MKALVQSSSPRKGYEELLIGTPSVEEFDRSDQERQRAKNTNPAEVVRLTGQPTSEPSPTNQKGQDAELSDQTVDQGDPSASIFVQDLIIDEIIADPAQPRTIFDPVALDELRDSIKEQGLQQPIIVRRIPSEQPETESVRLTGQPRFQLIAGERRWRAMKALGHPTIPGIVRENTSSLNNYLSALTENLQRENLHPLDEARAFKRILELEIGGEKAVKNQSQLAALLGINRRRISEKMQLLELPVEALEILFGNTSHQALETHAIELLRLSDRARLIPLCKRIVEEQLSTPEIRRQINAINLQTTLTPNRTKSSFKPIRKTQLGSDGKKGFDLTIKYRSDRREDREIIIATLKDTLDALEKTK